MEFIALMTKDHPVTNAELRSLTEHASICSYTHPYLVREKGEELAFVSLDFHLIEEQLVIYKIFVHSGVRGHGIGTRLLQIIENDAVRRGYRKILLHAHPLDSQTQEAKLRSWYEKHGYESQGDDDTMVKNLKPRTARTD